MIDIVTNRNCVYQTAYHVVWCPKYRCDVLVGNVSIAVGDMLDAICLERGWPVIAKEIQPDHIHLFLSIPPAQAVADAVKILKGITARGLFQKFPALKHRFVCEHCGLRAHSDLNASRNLAWIGSGVPLPRAAVNTPDVGNVVSNVHISQ
jgi:putative transposase